MQNYRGIKTIRRPRSYLKEKRWQLDLSQADVAEYLGIRREFYTRIENGSKGDRTSARTLQNLAEILKMTGDEILEAESAYMDQMDKLNNKVKEDY